MKRYKGIMTLVGRNCDFLNIIHHAAWISFFPSGVKLKAFYKMNLCENSWITTIWSAQNISELTLNKKKYCKSEIKEWFDIRCWRNIWDYPKGTLCFQFIEEQIRPGIEVESEIQQKNLFLQIKTKGGQFIHEKRFKIIQA